MSARQPFRPSRPRASLPSTSAPLVAANNENVTAPESDASTRLANRKKRAQSLGGAALDDARKKAKLSLGGSTSGGLSPGKIARRKLVPRRSILRAVPAVFDDPTATTTFEAGAHTTDLSSLSTVTFASKRRQSYAPPTAPISYGTDQVDGEEEDSGSDGEMDMDMTGVMDEGRRKSLARRVSFAPNAHIRTFTPDKPTAQAQALLQQQALLLQQKQDGAYSSQDEDEDENDRSGDSMEMAAEDTTRAFAGHFGGTVPASVYDEDGEGEEGEFEEEEEDMEVADGDVTSAYASQFTVVHNSQAPSSSSPQDPVDVKGKGKPRFSEVFRQEDAEDAAAMAELGMRRGAPPAAPVVAPPAPPSAKAKPRFSEVVRQQDADDEEVFRQLGLQKGRAPAQSSVSFGGVPSSDDDDRGEEATMDMTIAVGKVLSQTVEEEEDEDLEYVDEEDETVDMSFATVAVDRTMNLNEEDEDGTGAMDEYTTNMVEATTHGGILATSAPPPPQSPSPPPPAPLPTAVVPPTPSARLKAQLFQRPSIGGASPASPRLNSPRRVLLPASSVSATPPRASPRKWLPSPRRVTSTTPAASPMQSPSTLAPQSPATPRRAGRSLSLSPTKPLAPDSARRTPGGSLSLRGLMLEQQRELALPPSLVSPARQRWGSPRGGSARVDVIREAEGKEEDSTGSSLGGAYRDEESPAPAAFETYDAFFQATEMHFHKDIAGYAGLNLSNKPRKSIAPQEPGREQSGPPSFGDHIVAGACQSLFHILYRADQRQLSGEIQGHFELLERLDTDLQESQPTVFKEWAEATDAHRAIMLNQFRMIKTHYFLSGRIEWMEMRSENIGQIITAMEDSLDGLRSDNAMVEAAAFHEVLPGLEDRHAALQKELAEERARDVELTTCDQDTLLQLQEAIIEQTEQLRLHEQESAEVARRLADLTLKANELEQEELESARENEELQRMLELGRVSTKAEVFRLKAEFDALQQIHGWKLVEFNKSTVRLSHLDEFDVVLYLSQGVVRSVAFTLHPKPTATTGVVSEVTRFLFGKVVEIIEDVLNPSTEAQAAEALLRRPRSILSRISSLWSCTRRLRREIALTHYRFPTTASVLDMTPSVLHVITEIHVPKAKSTFEVVFDVTGDEILADEQDKRPAEDRVLANVSVDVRVRSGRVDSEALRIGISETLDEGGRGALLEACKDAEAKAGEN